MLGYDFGFKTFDNAFELIPSIKLIEFPSGLKYDKDRAYIGVKTSWGFSIGWGWWHFLAAPVEKTNLLKRK